MKSCLPILQNLNVAFVALFLFSCGNLSAQDIKFDSAPRLTHDAGRTIIEFSVSRTTDVEVSVVDDSGKVRRHLVAGVVGGKNPAPPPLVDGLRQKIVWDGKDNEGNMLDVTKVKVLVRAGMRVKFGSVIGSSATTGNVLAMPYRAPVNGLVVDDKGNLYVKLMSTVGSHGNSGMWPWHIRRFDREGKYDSTIFPYPSTTDPSRAHGIRLLPTPNAFTPANESSLYPVFATFGNEITPRLVAGQMVFVHSEKQELNFLSLDGENRVRTVPMWSANAKLNCPKWLDIQVAFSPNGRYAYYSNVAGTPYDGKRPSDVDPRWPQGRIYRQDLQTADTDPQPFFDLTLPDWETEKYWQPSAWDKKTAAAGIDTDAQGNLFVCDLVNHQIVEISAAGKLLSQTPVPWPDKIVVSRKGSDIYVISRKVSRGNLPNGTLRRISGRGKEAKIVAERQLPGTVGGAITLDENGRSPILWLAGATSEGSSKGKDLLLKIECRENEFVTVGDNFLNQDPNAITFVGYLDVDRENEMVYVTRSGDTIWRFHGDTGEGGPLDIKAADLAIGPGGQIVTWGSGSFHGPLTRYSKDLKPLPLEVTGKHEFGYVYARGGRGISVCGMDVDGAGRVFATFGSNDCHVRGYDLAGKLLDFPRQEKGRNGEKVAGEADSIPVAIAGVSGYGGSLRVDRSGNLYLLQLSPPKERTPPPGFEADEAYRETVGTIHKFPSTGGAVKHQNGNIKSLEGVLASYPDCGPISRWRAVGSCACTKPRFDVDDFGRIYIPNGITFSVTIRDNSNNEIIRFGTYGNFDEVRPRSADSMNIPFGWPIVVGASDKAIYVGDVLNHRVVRVDKLFAVESHLTVQ